MWGGGWSLLVPGEESKDEGKKRKRGRSHKQLRRDFKHHVGHLNVLTMR